ncbi:MAG: SgcJ/EcaC family oxidoreductase [Nevskia sp.]|nr:SgcJ/EcaC family oxidoreductase [Nevskia sp.]
MPATPAQVRAVIEQYVRAWATGDKPLLLSLFAEDAVWTDPVGTPPFQGHAGIGAFWDFAHQDSARQLMPRVNRVVACGNEGILDFTMEVRLPSANQGLDLRVVDRFVLDEQGRIRTAQAYWDEGSASAPPGMEFFVPNIDEAYQK